MKISNELYDLLNDVIKIGIPSIGAFYFTLASIFEWGYSEAVVGVIAALTTLLGVWLKILNHYYVPEVDGEISMNASDPEHAEIRISLEDIETLDQSNGSIISLKISSNDDQHLGG